jgi:hypothetical protein
MDNVVILNVHEDRTPPTAKAGSIYGREDV